MTAIIRPRAAARCVRCNTYSVVDRCGFCRYCAAEDAGLAAVALRFDGMELDPEPPCPDWLAAIAREFEVMT